MKQIHFHKIELYYIFKIRWLKKTFYQTILDDSFKYFYYSNTLGKYYLFNIVDKKTIQVLVYEDRENVILINNFKLILTDKEEVYL